MYGFYSYCNQFNITEVNINMDEDITCIPNDKTELQGVSNYSHICYVTKFETGRWNYTKININWDNKINESL